MQIYANRSGRSGVRRYAFGDTWIDVEFDGTVYRYDEDRPGRSHVETMKRLAEAGEGLGTYISQRVKTNYAARTRLPRRR